MDVTVDQLAAEAREMALELRLKDKLIAAQAQEITRLRSGTRSDHEPVKEDPDG
jgi:hypothetical protein